jgi:hypothetical protein
MNAVISSLQHISFGLIIPSDAPALLFPFPFSVTALLIHQTTWPHSQDHYGSLLSLLAQLLDQSDLQESTSESSWELPRGLDTDSWICSARLLSTTARVRSEHIDITDIPPTPISHLSEIETAMAESVSKFAQDVIAPKVREMDENEKMDPAIIEQLFEQGLMGIEIPEEYGGAGMNFTAAIVGIEELARVDPSVSVLVDVHNTLVNTAIIKWGSSQMKKKYLPQLATSTVGED